MRARDLGVVVGALEPGPRNAVTDVAGVRVGTTTLIEGDDVRTGATVVLPPDGHHPAGTFTLNGCGELTGLEWVRFNGTVYTPIALTSTFGIGTAHTALVRHALEAGGDWAFPVVGETWDGFLHDIRGMHLTEEHVREAIRGAGPDVPEGNVGGGTGMICHGFKGGTGTASRRLDSDDGGWTVGALVQANQGRREDLTIAGVPVGRRIGADRIPASGFLEKAKSSIVVVAATDAPLDARQCFELAKRACLGIARVGGNGEHFSGDFALAFSVAGKFGTVVEDAVDPLFRAAAEATEEAIVNALVAAETMTGYQGTTAYALDHELLRTAMEGVRP